MQFVFLCSFFSSEAFFVFETYYTNKISLNQVTLLYSPFLLDTWPILSQKEKNSYFYSFWTYNFFLLQFSLNFTRQGHCCVMCCYTTMLFHFNSAPPLFPTKFDEFTELLYIAVIYNTYVKNLVSVIRNSILWLPQVLSP